MRVVKASGMSWLDFAATHNGELAALPADQISDIMNFLGAPTDARYFKADQFRGDFDGAVDPKAGVTLFQRVKFVLLDGVKFGLASPGTPGWEEELRTGLEQFKADYKQVVERTWSKGSIRPACPIGSVKVLDTRVVVTVVESGEHNVITIYPYLEREGPDMVEHKGHLEPTSNLPTTKTEQVIDPTGSHPEKVTTTQIPSTHEFGHSIGLLHVRCPGSDNICYGATADERRSVMGAGDQLQVIKRGGKIVHDDFLPFKRIAKLWGSVVFPDELSECNKWSVGGK